MASLSAIARAVALVVVIPLARVPSHKLRSNNRSPARLGTTWPTTPCSWRAATPGPRRSGGRPTASAAWSSSSTIGDGGLASRNCAVLNAAGIPTLIETEGHDYLKKRVRERFSIERRKADWKSSAEQGSRAVSAPAFYVTFEGAPVELGWLARALLAAPERRLALLPDGEARIEWIETLQLSSKGRSRTVRSTRSRASASRRRRSGSMRMADFSPQDRSCS